MGYKPLVTIELKEKRVYYEGEKIPVVITLRLEKRHDSRSLKVIFKGVATSYHKTIKQHSKTIFENNETLSIHEYNKQPYNTPHEIYHDVKVDNDIKICSSKDLEECNEGTGGKIEYIIEARLESSGDFFRGTKILSHQIITVKIATKLDITLDKRLMGSREMTYYWPPRGQEHEENTCKLSAYIPQGGYVRNSNVNVTINFKQPGTYSPVKEVLVELLCQESIALAADVQPNTKHKLKERLVDYSISDVTMHSIAGQMKAFDTVVSLPLKLCLTPTIHRKIARVMKLDYTLRISVTLPRFTEKLQADLPITIGAEVAGKIEPPHTEFDLAFERIVIDTDKYSTSSDESPQHTPRSTLSMPQPNVFCHECVTQPPQLERNSYLSPVSSPKFMSPFFSSSSPTSSPYTASSTLRTYEIPMEKPHSKT